MFREKTKEELSELVEGVIKGVFGASEGVLQINIYFNELLAICEDLEIERNEISEELKSVEEARKELVGIFEERLNEEIAERLAEHVAANPPSAAIPNLHDVRESLRSKVIGLKNFISSSYLPSSDNILKDKFASFFEKIDNLEKTVVNSDLDFNNVFAKYDEILANFFVILSDSWLIIKERSLSRHNDLLSSSSSMSSSMFGSTAPSTAASSVSDLRDEPGLTKIITEIKKLQELENVGDGLIGICETLTKYYQERKELRLVHKKELEELKEQLAKIDEDDPLVAVRMPSSIDSDDEEIESGVIGGIAGDDDFSIEEEKRGIEEIKKNIENLNKIMTKPEGATAGNAVSLLSAHMSLVPIYDSIKEKLGKQIIKLEGENFDLETKKNDLQKKNNEQKKEIKKLRKDEKKNTGNLTKISTELTNLFDDKNELDEGELTKYAERYEKYQELKTKKESIEEQLGIFKDFFDKLVRTGLDIIGIEDRKVSLKTEEVGKYLKTREEHPKLEKREK